ncbi:MAG: DUF1566 domain-containing protein [Fibrobacterales bacterium]
MKNVLMVLGILSLVVNCMFDSTQNIETQSSQGESSQGQDSGNFTLQGDRSSALEVSSAEMSQTSSEASEVENSSSSDGVSSINADETISSEMVVELVSSSNRESSETNIESELEVRRTYKIVDTGLNTFFDNRSAIDEPSTKEAFYGQDAQHIGHQPSYTDNGDGTITDNVTGLMWQQEFTVMSYNDAIATALSLDLGGHNDWRVPTIKEAYSLMLFSGKDVSGPDDTTVPVGAVPFIDSSYFDFAYGANGTRIIDTQMLTSTIYTGVTMGRDETVFGVNVADGRIKGYPLLRQGQDNEFTVRFVRENTKYGVNAFTDNADGTISDNATGLMWQQADSESGMYWEEALEYAEQKNSEDYLGQSDWRLPNAKELHSIVDYTRSPQETNSAAIDTLFQVSEIIDEGSETNYPFYWSSTTHQNMMSSDNAVYFSFGEALGFFESPATGTTSLLDVHGAGAQRSDPKTGDPADWPEGHGPQGDVIRIYNYVRLVRDM